MAELVRPVRMRRPPVLEGIDVELGRGLEIGALDAPMIAPGEVDLRFADYVAPQARATLPPGVDRAALVGLDYVWGGGPGLATIVGGIDFDYVIASHVIQMVPDPVTWLTEIAAVLAPGGEIRLVVPDRRYMFDLRRAESGLAELIEAWLEQRRTPPARAALDMLLKYEPVDPARLWREGPKPPVPRPLPDPAGLLSLARELVDQRTYHEIHCWVFTPRSFAGLMAGLAELGVVSLACTLFEDTEEGGFDFIVGLRPAGRQVAIASWARAGARARGPG